MKFILAIFPLFLHSAWADSGHHMLGVGGMYGLFSTGVVQVRENAVIGDRLNLKDDLGLDRFVGLSVMYGYKLSRGWIDLSYSQYLLKGNATFTTNFNYNGATYAPGEVDISKTNYRRATVIYKHTVKGDRESISSLLLGGGIVVETLKFYIDGQLDPNTSRTEKFESFDSQTMPVPAVYAEWTNPISENLGFSLEFLGAWLPITKTPYKEKGNIYFEQHNAEAKVGLKTILSGAHLDGGYGFKYFMQKGNSREDTNEFRLSTSSIYLDARWYF